MDKNNDIQVNKISKWDAALKDMGALFTYIDMVIGMACCLLQEIRDNLYDLMDKMLDDYNELEAKYQEASGMISQYEEENRILRKQRKKLTDARDELADDNGNLRRERDIYAERLSRLCRTLSDNDIIADWSEAALKWSLYKWDEVKNQWCSYDKATTLESCKKHYEEELRIREKEKDEKDKLIEELNSKIKELKLRTNIMYGCYGYGLNTPGELNRKIEVLKKENKELKDTIEKDGEFGRNVGNRVAESIREGCDKGAYKLHPYTRIDIHVEETNNMPTTFDRHAIPRIAVMFNNTQTEMERDTAEHECEELNKKVDTVWRANEELNRKIKELEKENNNLTTDTKRLSDAVEAWFNMFNDMRHKRDFLKKEYEKLKETNKSCPVACECENFKPKVHHTYDPLDDLPDVEHS